jgi:pimeloyl-ACP methyl ester carboxylesterase
MSVFDSPAFNDALFFPRPDVTPPPTGAVDRFVDVPGARLHVRIHPGPAPVLLLFHGNGEVVADYDDTAARFAEAGARLAVTDFRGYGASTGAPCLRDALADAAAVLAAVAPRVVMGRSLGGNCAAELCQTARADVRGYVFESAAMDLVGLVARRGIAATLTEDDRRTFDPLPKLARCTTPTLFLHGERDTLIHPVEAERGHAAVPGSSLVWIPDRGHNDLSSSPRYWDALAGFLRPLVD